MKQEDRNLLLVVGIVVLVSLVAMVAIFSVIWGLVGTPVSSLVSAGSRFIHLQNLDYNFEIPAKRD
jgi:hypothetical protein